MPNGAANLSQKFGGKLKAFQTGYIFQYAFVTIFAVLALLSLYLLMPLIEEVRK